MKKFLIMETDRYGEQPIKLSQVTIDTDQPLKQNGKLNKDLIKQVFLHSSFKQWVKQYESEEDEPFDITKIYEQITVDRGNKSVHCSGEESDCIIVDITD